MHRKKKKEIKLKIHSFGKIFFSSIMTVGTILPLNVISQPLTKPRFNEVNRYTNKSFITNAVERTGSSVVTIDTQRYIKKRRFPRN